MTAQYIVVEGLEGAGKTTAIEVIKQWLTTSGVKNVITTREPGGTPIAEQLRQMIKHQYLDDTMDVMTELLILYAARVQLVNQVIKPALQQGTWVIGDRHDLSTRAYQGGGRGIDALTLDTLAHLSLRGFKANATIYLDIEPKLGLQRILRRGTQDRIEQESVAFFKRVRAVYCDYALRDPTIYLVDANQPLLKVHADISQILQHISDVSHD